MMKFIENARNEQRYFSDAEIYEKCVNECSADFLKCSEENPDEFRKCIEELEGNFQIIEKNLKVLSLRK